MVRAPYPHIAARLELQQILTAFRSRHGADVADALLRECQGPKDWSLVMSGGELVAKLDLTAGAIDTFTPEQEAGWEVQAYRAYRAGTWGKGEAVEVCPACDIAGCRHIRARRTEGEG